MEDYLFQYILIAKLEKISKPTETSHLTIILV